MPDKVTATSNSTTEKRDASQDGAVQRDSTEDLTGTHTETIEIRNDIPEGHKNALIAQLGPRSAPIVGNLADLQRLGAEVAAGHSNAPKAAVGQPVTTSDEDFKAGAERTLREEKEAKESVVLDGPSNLGGPTEDNQKG